jgi:hypothetical protein
MTHRVEHNASRTFGATEADRDQAAHRASGAGCSSAPVLPALYPALISVSSSLLAATMNQKSSLREDPQFVSWTLTGNILERGSGLFERSAKILVGRAHELQYR